MRSRTIATRLVPFALAAALPFPTAFIPPERDHPELMVWGAVLTVVVALSSVLLPWGRLPVWAPVVPSILYCVSIALMRHAEGGATSGLSLLLLLPVVWQALYGTRGHLIAILVATTATLVAPIVLVGLPNYSSGEWRRTLVWAVIAPMMGLAVQRLVQHVREAEANLATMADVARGITLDGDVRTGICEAVLEVAGADLVLLLEPDGTGDLVSTAGAGPDLAPVRVRLGEEPSGAGIAFTSRRPFFVRDLAGHPAVSQRHVAATRTASGLFQPVLHGQETLGVLCILWRRPLRRLATPVSGAMRVLAADAAVAIERSAMVETLRRTARNDALTGLPNRRAWDDDLKREMVRARRTARPLVVALLDLDHFKVYNDTYGHQAGDLMLKEAAAAWRSQLREVDVLARWGGEEFGVLLPDCSLDDAREVLRRLRAATPGGQTCSAGATSWQPDDSTDTLTARADQALYAAKTAGRDRTVVG